MAPVEVEAQDAVRFQRFIFQSQFPQDCSTTTGVLTRAGLKEGQERWPGDYFYGLGLGSQMASLKFNFAKALLSGRVYHFPTSHYVNPIRCASQTFDCYFAPPTNCSRVVAPGAPGAPGARRLRHRAMDTAPLLWCFELPRRRLSRLAGLSAVHSEAWYQGQLAAFLFRPNREMQAYRAEALHSFAFDANHTRAAALDTMVRARVGDDVAHGTRRHDGDPARLDARERERHSHIQLIAANRARVMIAQPKSYASLMKDVVAPHHAQVYVSFTAWPSFMTVRAN